MARQNNDQTSVRKLNMVGAKSFAVSIPITLIRQLQWQKGDALVVRRHGAVLLIEKQKEL
jgi:antitoxin component of MazEF toxin-antitoxin module